MIKFILGFMLGGMAGVFTMCLLQIKRGEEDGEEWEMFELCYISTMQEMFWTNSMVWELEEKKDRNNGGNKWIRNY